MWAWASQVAGKGSRIYMNPIDNAGMNRFLTHPDGWGNQALRFLGEGFPPDELAVVKENNPGRKYRPNSVLEAIPVEDGTEIEVGRPAEGYLYPRPYPRPHLLVL